MTRAIQHSYWSAWRWEKKERPVLWPVRKRTSCAMTCEKKERPVLWSVASSYIFYSWTVFDVLITMSSFWILVVIKSIAVKASLFSMLRAQHINMAPCATVNHPVISVHCIMCIYWRLLYRSGRVTPPTLRHWLWFNCILPLKPEGCGTHMMGGGVIRHWLRNVHAIFKLLSLKCIFCNISSVVVINWLLFVFHKPRCT